MTASNDPHDLFQEYLEIGGRIDTDESAYPELIKWFEDLRHTKSNETQLAFFEYYRGAYGSCDTLEDAIAASMDYYPKFDASSFTVDFDHLKSGE